MSSAEDDSLVLRDPARAVALEIASALTDAILDGVSDDIVSADMVGMACVRVVLRSGRSVLVDVNEPE